MSSRWERGSDNGAGKVKWHLGVFICVFWFVRFCVWVCAFVCFCLWSSDTEWYSFTLKVTLSITWWATMVITERQGQMGRGAATYFHLLQRLPIWGGYTVCRNQTMENASFPWEMPTIDKSAILQWGVKLFYQNTFMLFNNWHKHQSPLEYQEQSNDDPWS